MSMEERWAKTALAVTLGAMLSVSGCGYKDDPVPPQHVLPQAINDLRVDLDDQGATLSWAYPRKTVTGGDIEEIDSFELYRAEIPVASYCPTCPVPYSSIIKVPGGMVVPGSGKTAVYELHDLRPGNLYILKVRSQSGWWQHSQDSNEVSFLWQTPPKTPAGLSCQSGDGRNLLQWQAVSELKDGGRSEVAIRYQLYRGVDGGAMEKLAEPLNATSYTDTAVENGRTYAYQVRSVSTYAQGSVNSGLSESVQATPMDTTPPPVPTGLAALRTEIGVKVYWDAVESEDLAGYRIYRRQPGQAAPVLVGEVNLPHSLLIDSKAPDGALLYSVSSIDTRSPANESVRSAEVAAE